MIISESSFFSLDKKTQYLALEYVGTTGERVNDVANRLFYILVINNKPFLSIRQIEVRYHSYYCDVNKRLLKILELEIINGNVIDHPAMCSDLANLVVQKPKLANTNLQEGLVKFFKYNDLDLLLPMYECGIGLTVDHLDYVIFCNAPTEKKLYVLKMFLKLTSLKAINEILYKLLIQPKNVDWFAITSLFLNLKLNKSILALFRLKTGQDINGFFITDDTISKISKLVIYDPNYKQIMAYLKTTSIYKMVGDAILKRLFSQACQETKEVLFRLIDFIKISKPQLLLALDFARNADVYSTQKSVCVEFEMAILVWKKYVGKDRKEFFSILLDIAESILKRCAMQRNMSEEDSEAFISANHLALCTLL